MKRKVAGFIVCLLAASVVGAQNIQPIQLAPRAAAPVQIDQEAMEKQRLERENAKLREENAALKQRVDNFSNLGGSEVRAYCPNLDSLQTSRNTAGAESNCAQSGYLCDPVSGLCRTSCQTSNMCAGGFTCDTSIQQCVHTG